MSESETGYVYTLNDPRNGEPKYVGATKNPEERLYTHKHGATNDDVSSWISCLEAEGMEPKMEVVTESELDKIPELELEVIEKISKEYELLNRRKDGAYTSLGGSRATPGTPMKVPDSVHAQAHELADDNDMSMKEAVRLMCREGGYDV